MSARATLRGLIASQPLRMVWAAAIVVALLFTLPPMPEQAPRFAHADKLFHAGYFAVLGLLAALSQRHERAAGRAALAMIGLGIAIELIQWRLPWRSFEALDILADGLGVALGLAAARRLRAQLLANRG
ncbi:MAG TPA: VanZ family protein [Fontimonas sp.]